MHSHRLGDPRVPGPCPRPHGRLLPPADPCASVPVQIGRAQTCAGGGPSIVNHGRRDPKYSSSAFDAAPPFQSGPIRRLNSNPMDNGHKQLLILLEAHANKQGEVPAAKYTNRVPRPSLLPQQSPSINEEAGPPSRQRIDSAEDIDALLQCVAFPRLAVREKAGTGGARSNRAGAQTERVKERERALEAKRVEVAEKKQRPQTYEQVTAVQVVLS